MAKSKRVQILEVLTTTIRDTVPILKAVHNRQFNMSLLETTPLPAVFIEGDDENRSPNPEIGREEWLWDIEVSLWVNEGSDIEALLKEISDGVGTNRRLDGLAHWIIRTSARPFMLSTDENMRLMKINFEVNYSHTLGDM